jgi:hypothetical protein
MANIRQIKALGPDRQEFRCDVVDERETEYIGNSRLRVHGETRLIRLSGEWWHAGGPIHGNVLIERVGVEKGKPKTTHAIGRWLP